MIKKLIKLTFETFNLESIDNRTGKCNDFLQINDGSSSQEPLIDAFCGDRKPDQIQKYIK